MSSPPPHPPREVELKLSFERGDLPRLLRHPVLLALTRGRASTKNVRSLYWDTPELDLHHHGLVLRLRDAGAGSIQTVKTQGTARGGLFDREEAEARVPGTEPMPEAIPDPVLRAAVEAQTAAEDRGLAPVVETEVRRTRRLLEYSDSEIECVVDVGEVRCSLGASPILEVELELLRGEPAVLYGLARELQQSVALSPVTQGKAEVGFSRLTGEEPTPRKSRRLELSSKASLDQVLEPIFAECLGQITDNFDAALCGADPEGVHQMRIGTRRLRSALALFGEVLPEGPSAELAEEVRWLGGALGGKRDMDVLVAELLEPLAQRHPLDPGMKRLLDVAGQVQARRQEELRGALCSQRYGALVLRLGHWVAARGWRSGQNAARLERRATREARRQLRRRHRRVLRRGRKLSQRSPEELHRLRIACKQLRYACEFLGGLFDEKASRRLARRVSRVQDVLGHLNDAATAERLLGELAAAVEADADPEVARALGLVQGWSDRGALAAADVLEERWRSFRKTPIFWPRDER